MIARVYRPERSWKGDIVGDLEDYHVGDVDVVMGGPAPQDLRHFPGVVSTEGMIGVRRGPVDVQQHDRLLVDNVLYAVTGPKQWDFPNELTGTVPDWVWFEVRSTT